MTEHAVSGHTRNRYDRMEIAGAFGDLGTLVPFVVAYIGLLKMDPFGILFAFGISMVACGLIYRTPVPVQPMKAAGAIATTQAVQTLVVTPAMVWAASLATGIVWLALGLTGTARYVAKLIKRPVVLGIILGLGFGFMIEGAKMMSQNWWIGGAVLLATSLLLSNRIVPAMFLVLLFGAAYGLWSDPSLLPALQEIQFQPRLPVFALHDMTLNDFILGLVFVALPQVPLTLGNAVIAITEENNLLFPERPVDESRIATSTGLMNIASAAVGGIPMCHGAGGMAGHVQFGARTGGSLVILGALLLVLAVCFSGSIATLLKLFPPAVLGVILFLTGAQLAMGACEIPSDKGERFVLVVTAALAVWNVGIAFLVGTVAIVLNKKGWLRL